MTVFNMSLLRFSDDPTATVEFLELLGLRRTTWTDGYIALRGDSGQVAVHSTATSESGAHGGETNLGFEVADLDQAIAELAEAGIESTSWDEAWGREASVRGNNGLDITISERPTDFYGYEHAEPQPLNGIQVVTLLESRDIPTDSEYFAAFGYLPNAAREHLEGDGIIALRTAPVGEGAGYPATLAFRTAEPLAHLTERLHLAGFAPRPLDRGLLTVDDPDGQTVEITPRDP